MVSQKPKFVIIGAGIAGLAAANKLYTTQNSNELFELCVVEGGNRIGGRIFTSEFCGDKIEIGATWIHGIEGNPIYKIAKETNSFESDQPWECMEESEYCDFPGDEIVIAKGYSKVIESLASVLPAGLIQPGRKVAKIEWQSGDSCLNLKNEDSTKPVKLHFGDGSVMCADHVIVTVSLGVLKQGIHDDDFGLFSPPLPKFKNEAISRLGFGVVDKLFLQLSPNHDENIDKLFLQLSPNHDENVGYDGMNFPHMQLVFHKPDAKVSQPKIPSWIRKTALLHPIYPKSSVLLSWFAGEEAIEMETLDDEEIMDGVLTTISQFLANSKHFKKSNFAEERESCIKFTKILKCKWGTDPLFLGSYSYIAVGSSGDDLDALAEPLPNGNLQNYPQLQVLFAGEATSRTQYSTTHGAYLTGLREANRLLEHFQCVDV
ncbi:probable polyamine oxidase 5 isoform X2 [Lycium barbarum]|uniref:probable polyamine oxidase 5 isoform X2 n=1 Tax=Lycium barbarum TaxID=112863 RepID=UPI00293E1C6A|nr:probable polyamine oxidase 5 isoform X2 [Lycium barbarum]